MSNQPAWRLAESDSIAKLRTNSGDVSNLKVWGQYGLFEFMMLLGWWGLAIKDGKQDKNREEAQQGLWSEALADMTWVLESAGTP
jgi:hypothetical protein